MILKWPEFNKNGSVIIGLSTKYFCIAEKTVDVYGDAFTPKDELHVTLIGTRLGSIIMDEIKQNKTIGKLLDKAFEEIDWSFRQTGPVHILSRRKDNFIQKSIIMLIEMHGVTEFYDRLRALGLLETNTPVPPPHVTMYTQNCPLGIGVPDRKTLDILSRKKLSVDALNKLCLD
ncbi:MAG: hypothetical protein GQ549_01315 [Gammaproteobacteria bacterium]|nr:hypothetical protein [Gammaproteobacteria bacterium]